MRIVSCLVIQALDTIGVASPLSKRCTQSRTSHLLNRHGVELFRADFYDALKDRSSFPYTYIVPQPVTEEELTRKLREQGVEVWRGERYKVVGIHGNDEDGALVQFEDGEKLEAKYIIGADGARSIVSVLFRTTFPSKH